MPKMSPLETSPHNQALDPRSQLIVCPHCDAAYKLIVPKNGERATCARCHTVLIAPRRKAGLQIIAVSIAVVVLIFGAAVFPFLSIEAGGVSNAVSIIDVAVAFQHGVLIAVSLFTLGLILIVPLMRVLLVLYVLIPIVMDQKPYRHAIQAFRISEVLRPWSMAEVFAVGCAVALTKIAGLATVHMGPAFYIFAAIVVLVVVSDSFMCRWTVWNALDQKTVR